MSLRSVVRKIYEKSVFERKFFFSTATYASAVRHSHINRNSWISPAPCKVLGYNGKFWLEKNAFHDFGFQVHRERSITNEEQVDPFALVADELALMANRLRSMVVTEIPKLATAAEYFFKMGVEGKRFRPMVLLLMASSLTMAVPEMAANSFHKGFAKELRLRQQRIAEITEMIHVASLLHDDVLDDAETRRGISSLNFMMGNKLAVLAGDFLLSRASVALASLKDTEVVELLSKVLEHLVTGEIMQMTTSSEQCCSMEYYMQKTFFKTASLMANSCKAIALLAGQPREVAMLAYDYGRNLGLAYQLVDDVLDYTGTTASLGKGPLSDIRQALEFLGKSQGIRKAKQLAAEHADQAASAVDSFPASDIENVKVCRKALVDLTKTVVTRTK